jgi:hypothetical protein
MLLASIIVGASALAACLLPTFSDVLPGSTTPIADSGPDAVVADAGGDGGLTGCDDPVGGALAIWPMTEGSGSIVHDCGGNYPGTFKTTTQGNVNWTTGRSGEPALQMSGGYVALIDLPALQVAGPFTVTAWINASSLQVDSFGDILARYASISTAAFDVTVTKDPLVSLTLFSNGNIVQASGSITYGVWKHIAATYAVATGDAEMFVNGTSSGIAKTAAALPAIPTIMTFGANSVGTSVYFGKIAGIHIYTRVLTQIEITKLATP